jgi:hypothetical protein
MYLIFDFVFEHNKILMNTKKYNLHMFDYYFLTQVISVFNFF